MSRKLLTILLMLMAVVACASGCQRSRQFGVYAELMGAERRSIEEKYYDAAYRLEKAEAEIERLKKANARLKGDDQERPLPLMGPEGGRSEGIPKVDVAPGVNVDPGQPDPSAQGEGADGQGMGNAAPGMGANRIFEERIRGSARTASYQGGGTTIRFSGMSDQLPLHPNHNPAPLPPPRGNVQPPGNSPIPNSVPGQASGPARPTPQSDSPPVDHVRLRTIWTPKPSSASESNAAR